MRNEALRNRLAARAHRVWSSWMIHLFRKVSVIPGRGYMITTEDADRWKRQTETPFENLSSEEQKSDFEIADGYIDEFFEVMNEELHLSELDRPTTTSSRDTRLQDLSEMDLLRELVRRSGIDHKFDRAPNRREYVGEHWDLLFGIGKDNTADLTLTSGDLDALFAATGEYWREWI